MSVFGDYFRNKINTAGSKTEVLLIGEDHINSSALIALAHAVQEHGTGGKKIVIVTEDLPEKKEFGRSSSYSTDKIRSTLAENDHDRDALLYLIDSGAIVHGLENKESAPGLFIQGSTKAELYVEARQHMPSIFQDEQGNPDSQKENNILAALKDHSYDEEGFKDFLNRRYGESHARIQDTNRVAANKIVRLVNKYPSDTLVVFCGGAAHIPKARDNKSPDVVVDEGIMTQVSSVLPRNNVSSCFVTSLKVTRNESYTPKNDGAVLYEPISAKLNAPYAFKKEATVALNKSSEPFGVFNLFKQRANHLRSKIDATSLTPNDNKENTVSNSIR
ncbi:MAG: hypothetical protein CK426_07300 [Legionella sp.]|nr:MAG: hypothetical protein CK423_04520 [Legionella sp.]PJD98027.1 MAG: hypothetical protein CK426_07300 [Legionella sp.]